MKKLIDSFFLEARRMMLSPEEKQSIAKRIGIPVRRAGDARLGIQKMDTGQFLTSAKGLSLDPSERAALKEQLFEKIDQRRGMLWLWPFRGMVRLTATVLVFSIGGVSLSFAAESSLPGDLLYPVKIHVNEEVRARLAGSAEASAEWEAVRAERRLQEAETLSKEKRLTAVAEQELAVAFRKHATRVREKLGASIRDDSQSKTLSIEFEATLRAHREALAGQDNEREDALLLTAVDEARLSTEESIVESAATRHDAQGHASVVRAVLQKAEQEMKTTATASSRTSRMIERADSATRALKDARDHSGSTDDEKNLELARTALRKIKEAQVLESLGTDDQSQPNSASTSVNASASADLHVRHRNNAEQEDLNVNAEARLNVGQRKLQKLKEKMKSASTLPVDLALPTESRTKGAEQLLDIANEQLKEGNAPASIETSGTAMQHVDSAGQDLDEALGGGVRKN